MFNTGCFIVRDDEEITKKNIERANISKFENWKMDKDLRSAASMYLLAEQLFEYIRLYTWVLIFANRVKVLQENPDASLDVVDYFESLVEDVETKKETEKGTGGEGTGEGTGTGTGEGTDERGKDDDDDETTFPRAWWSPSLRSRPPDSPRLLIQPGS